jgi:hypothetical protein
VALSGGEPLWLLLALIELPSVFFLATIGVISSLSGLGARGARRDSP